MNHPDGLVRQNVDVTRREADLLVQLPERGIVGSLATVPPAAEVLPDAVGLAHEGAVLAHDEGTGAQECGGSVATAAKHGVRDFSPRRAGAGGGA